MDFIDGDRLVYLLSCDACGDPSFVTPGTMVQAPNYRCGSWWVFGTESERIGLLWQELFVGPEYLVLVRLSLADSGQEYLPDTRTAASAHRVSTAIPTVEVSDDGCTVCIRCPDGEMRTLRAFM